MQAIHTPIWIRSLCASVSLWLVLIAAAYSNGQTRSAPVIPVDGQPFEAQLQAVDDKWNLELAASSGQVQKLPVAELVQWGHWPPPKGAKQIVLADGGMLIVAEVLGIQDDALLAESDLLTKPTVRLPLQSIAGIIFQAPLDQRKRDLLEDRLLSASGKSDRLLLANGDELSGTIAGLTDKSLPLTTAAGTTPIALSRLTAAIFNPVLRAKPSSAQLSAWVGLRDGSRLRATKLTTSGQDAEITLSSGQALRIPLEALVALQPIGGQVVYLSQLSPASYRHIPYLSLPWEYGANRSVGGVALRADGRRYLMGIGMHSAARLTFDLDAPYRRFDVLLAIDDETAGRGSVIGRVFTDDGSGQWKLRYESPVIRGGQPPTPVSVDVSGAKRLSLLIDFADRADEADHADWLNARLVR